MSATPSIVGTQTRPGVATVEGGLVLLDGPNGVAVTMTAYAASETGKSLIEAARRAEHESEPDA